jgi:hypothetical protein
MRALAVGLAISSVVFAQSTITPVEPSNPPEQQPPQYQPPPPQYQQQPYPSNPPSNPQQYQPPPQQYPPPPGQSTISDPTQPQPTYQPSYLPPPGAPPRLVVTPDMQARWNRSRYLYGAGGVIGLVGNVLTISSIVVEASTGYPCDPNDLVHQLNPKDSCNRNGINYHPPGPTDAVPLLGYLGSSASAVGFVFAAAGLGYQHSLLRQMNADIDRGVFHGGTSLGVFGFAATGLGYFFGLTDYLNPHDQGIAIFATTVIGTALCTLGTLLYTIDATRTKKAWQKLSTF